MILCGWCGQPTEPGRCGNCHRDPAIPWVQRGVEVPTVDPHEDERQRLAAARRALGPGATIENLAEYLDVAERTVRRWQKLSGS